MKQKRLVSMIGALVVIIGAVALITGCSQPNSNTGSTSEGNSQKSLDVKPTGESDIALKGTKWVGEGRDMYFSEDGNIASINDEQMLYTVQGEKISFDLSSFISNLENMTEEMFIRERKIDIERDIVKLGKKIEEAEKNGDTSIQKKLKSELEEMKEILRLLKNPDEQMKDYIKEALEGIHDYADKMKPYAKFDGIFNNEKIELTLEEFPSYDRRTKEVTIKKIVFEKE